MSKTLFVYHGSCFDGHTAAWIYSRFVDKDAEFLPVKYGDAPPDVSGRDVIIADFSFPRAQTKEIIATAKSVALLDHHVTAREALDDINGELSYDGVAKQARIVFDMERSGAGIVWDELVATQPIEHWASASDKAWEDMTGENLSRRRPPLVNYVEDRDLWRMALPHAHEFMANVYAAPMTFESWDDLYGRSLSLDSMLVRGEGILAYMAQYGEKALAEAHQMRITNAPRTVREIAMSKWAHVFEPSSDGQGCAASVGATGESRCGYTSDEPCHRTKVIDIPDVWCVNLPYMNCSDYLTRLLAEKSTPFVAGYFRRADGQWQFSLRSTADFDCSAVAKVFGGGGHAQASGFAVSDLSEVFV